MNESYGARGERASVRAAIRLIGARPGTSVPDAAVAAETLESAHAPTAYPPRVDPSTPLEAAVLERIAVRQAPVPGFGAFLDGIQRSVIVGHFDATVPVVHGTVAAAIRERIDHTLRTWGDGARIERALFFPVARVPAAAVDALQADGFAIVDTTPSAATTGHPHELLGFARQAIQQRRESHEAALARVWCERERRPLYVDGGIGAFADAARDQLAVGVVKSHHTLYVTAEAVPTVAALAPGERTSAFLVSTRLRTRVASWYLRIRASDGVDPFSGIVRVEVAEDGFTADRADLVSAWVLAEREPVSLPDPRWRVMAYGVRDCEQYLRAVAG